MLIIPDKKLLIITPAKAGSTTLHRMLADRDRIADRCTHPFHSRHGCAVSHDFKDFKKYIVTRDPLERAKSLYNHAQQFERQQTFDEFAKTLIDRNWFFRPVSEYEDSIQLAGHPYTRFPIDGYLRIESIREDLEQIGIVSQPLHEEKTPAVAVTYREIQWNIRLTNWCEEDRFRYDYPFDRERLRWISNLIKPETTVCEVGVQRGNHAADILRCKPKSLTLVDCWTDTTWPFDHRNHDYVQEKLGRFSNVEIIKSDSVAYARDVIRQWDVVYIDGGHTTQEIQADLLAWWPRVKDGGILCGHDYIDLDTQPLPIEVKSAVDKFAAEIGRPVEHNETTTEWKINK